MRCGTTWTLPHAENGEDEVTEEEWAARRRLVTNLSYSNKRDSDN
jgi:hypothetical protein